MDKKYNTNNRINTDWADLPLEGFRIASSCLLKFKTMQHANTDIIPVALHPNILRK